MHDDFRDHQSNPADPRNRFRGLPIISDQISREGLETVINELEAVLRHGAHGAVVEFGCYAGTTSLFIRRSLDAVDQSGIRQFHVYDSFEGLPEKSAQDQNAAGIDFTAGKLYASKKELLGQFRNAGLRPPIAHKGWFDKLKAGDVPDHIAFAFLDGDFYDSIISSLRLVWPRMSHGGCIVIDDYKRQALPGVEHAISDFFRNKPAPVISTAHYKAIIRIPGQPQ